MAVTVTTTKQAEKDIADLPALTKVRIADAVVRLAGWPDVSNVKALKGELKGLYRLRVGVHRIVFRFENGTLTIERVADRKDIYG